MVLFKEHLEHLGSVNLDLLCHECAVGEIVEVVAEYRLCRRHFIFSAGASSSLMHRIVVEQSAASLYLPKGVCPAPVALHRE